MKSAVLLPHSGLGLIGVAVALAATSTGWGIAVGHGTEALPINPIRRSSHRAWRLVLSLTPTS